MRRHKALVIHDDPQIVDELSEVFASLGHKYEWAHSQEEARRLLSANDYSHILLDLEIPARSEHGQPRVRNGMNLLEEIRGDERLHGVPVIVVANQGVVTLRLAVWLMKRGAADILEKPFPAEGYTLDRAVKKAVAEPDPAQRHAAAPKLALASVPAQFQGGEMVFRPDRVELCGVKIVGNNGTGQMRRILDVLAKKGPNGQYAAFGGTSLAKAVEADAGENSVAGSIRRLRENAVRALRERGIVCGLQDIVQSGGKGYRLNGLITVRHAHFGT